MAAGYFGKMRSHGDFLGRRLAPAMQQPLDVWLQAGLVRSRVELGQDWLPTWLCSPLWRFILAPGVCGGQAWAGILMPSADRVGRCFPLVLAAAIDGAPSLTVCLTAHAGWFLQLEQLALSSLDDDFAIAQFDAALAALGGAPPRMSQETAERFPLARAVCQVAPLTDASDGRAARLPALALTALDGCSAWWTDGSERVAPCLAVCPGLPPAPAFCALLDGAWLRHGWEVVEP